jgi:hypothetical protein
MLVSDVNASIPPWSASKVDVAFQPVEPGKQFSIAIALPVEHDASRAVALTTLEAGEAPEPLCATTL